MKNYPEGSTLLSSLARAHHNWKKQMTDPKKVMLWMVANISLKNESMWRSTWHSGEATVSRLPSMKGIKKEHFHENLAVKFDGKRVISHMSTLWWASKPSFMQSASLPAPLSFLSYLCSSIFLLLSSTRTNRILVTQQTLSEYSGIYEGK